MSKHDRARYHAAAYLAEYYRWSAGRGFPLVGNSPLTGRKRSHFNNLDRAEGGVANKALARFWLSRARAIREGSS